MTSRLSHYLIEETIGAGSFSSVHRAVDERLGDTVAIKILAENHSLNPEIRERFIAEGRALRRVGGHGVPAVYDIGESDRQQPYLVLEHADGGSLRVRVEALRAGGWRAERHDLLALARPLAAGIADVHRARIVHRDLSPGNLLLASRASSGEETGLGSHLVRDDERLLISDLGMCKDLALNSGLTVAGGTSGFRPPEQNAPGTVDTRADIWAISALMSWAAEGATLPAELTRVLARGQANRPARRQPDAGTWLREVEAALAPPEPAPVAPQPAPRTVDEAAPDPCGIRRVGRARLRARHRAVDRTRSCPAVCGVRRVDQHLRPHGDLGRRGGCIHGVGRRRGLVVVGAAESPVRRRPGGGHRDADERGNGRDRAALAGR